MATALNNFAFATVMDVYGFTEEGALEAAFTALTGPEGEAGITGEAFHIDSLTISNITQEGPTKEARGGIEGRPLFRHGKTVRLEMEDVVARAEVLEAVFGVKATGTSGLSVNDKFIQEPLGLLGRTYVIDKDTGNRQWVAIKFNKFLPDGVFDITMEAEGDFGTISIAGELFADDCGEFFQIQPIEGVCGETGETGE